MPPDELPGEKLIATTHNICVDEIARGLPSTQRKHGPEGATGDLILAGEDIVDIVLCLVGRDELSYRLTTLGDDAG